MLNNIKLFIIISLVLILGLSFSIGLFARETMQRELIQVEQEKTKILVSNYQSTIWERHHNVLMRLARLEPNKWQNYREFHAFKKDTIEYFIANKTNDISLHLSNGVAILSSTNNDLTELNIPTTNANFAQVINGKPSYQINDDKNIDSLLPILTSNQATALPNIINNIEAVIAIKTDISRSLGIITELEFTIIGGIIVTFLLLLLFMMFFSKRAEIIISKQHEINLELTAAASAAEAENRDKSMFLANISHELRTPLNAIIGFSDILSNDLEGRLELKHKEYLVDINSSGKHLLSLINDILEYSKAEAGKLEVDLGEIDAIKMVKNTIRLMIPRADEAQVTMQEELPKQSFVLHTDAKKIKQILLNLLSNSVKFTPPNGKVKVTAWHDVARNRAMFVVTDTGIGIAPKDISKVMSPFGQVDSELSRRYEGTGLGLPLSKRLVELLGGTFTIESEVGVGTTITLDLPMRLERHSMGVV